VGEFGGDHTSVSIQLCHQNGVYPPIDGAGGRWMVLRNSGEWRQMAEQARVIAADMDDAEARRTMLEIAAGYDRLAARSERREAEECG